MLNLIVYWNTYYLDRALDDLLRVQPEIDYDDLVRITPLVYDHIRVLGRYSFAFDPHVQQGHDCPLNPLELEH